MVSPEVFRTRNIIIGFVAVSFFVLSSCICCIAFNPVGVAALSSPSIFEAIFMKMLPITGWFFGISGKRRVKTGLSALANTFTTPAFSPIFMMPSRRASTPVSPREKSRRHSWMSRRWNLQSSSEDSRISHCQSDECEDERNHEKMLSKCNLKTIIVSHLAVFFNRFYCDNVLVTE